MLEVVAAFALLDQSDPKGWATQGEELRRQNRRKQEEEEKRQQILKAQREAEMANRRLQELGVAEEDKDKCPFYTRMIG